VSRLDYLVSRELEQRLDTLLEGLSRGTPTNWEEYCNLVGEIRGLRYAQQALLNARRTATPEEED
jgi:hypothetical protein